MGKKIKILKLNQGRLILLITIVIGTIEIMDSIIITIALPAISQSLKIINSTQLSLILTSYLITSAMILPLAGYLVGRYGRKQILMINIISFILSSIICSFSNSFLTILIGRILQGACGGLLIPLSLAILRDNFSKEKQLYVNSIWSLGVMIAPILGPSIGGLMCEFLSWRWLFFINVPIGILILYVLYRLSIDTDKKETCFSFCEFFLLISSVGFFHLYLTLISNPSYNNSFAKYILILVLLFSSGYILRLIFFKSNILNLALFKRLNFVVCNIFLLLYSFVMFAFLAIEPLLFKNILNLSTIESGNILSIRGFACFIAIMIIPKLAAIMNLKYFILISLFFTFLNNFIMSQAVLTLNTLEVYIAFFFSGLGIGFFYTPITTIAFNSVPNHCSDDAASTCCYFRMLGTTSGISIINKLFNHVILQVDLADNLLQRSNLQILDLCGRLYRWFSLLPLVLIILIFFIKKFSEQKKGK